MNPILKALGGILKPIVGRKLVEKIAPEVAKQPSTIIGATAATTAMVVSPAAELAEFGLTLPPEYDLIIRVITLLFGCYLVFTEKKGIHRPD